MPDGCNFVLGERPKHLTGQELALANYNQDHRKVPESSAEFRDRLYNQDLKPVLSNADAKADRITANESTPNPTYHVNSLKPGDAVQCRSSGELRDVNNGNALCAGNDLEPSAGDISRTKWLPQESDPSNGKE